MRIGCLTWFRAIVSGVPSCALSKMEGKKIMWDRKELKMRGRVAFKANYWRCVLVGVFYANPYQFCTGAELYRVLKNQ